MPQIPRARRTEKPVKSLDLPKSDVRFAGAAALTAAGMGKHVTELGVEMRKQELRAEAADRAMKLSIMQRDLIDKADSLEKNSDVLESTGDRHEGLYSEKLDGYAQDMADGVEDPLLRDEYFKVYDQVGVKYRARARTEAHSKRVDHIATGLIELENKLQDAAVKNPNSIDSLAVELSAAYSAQVTSGMISEKVAAVRNDEWVDKTMAKVEANQERIAWRHAANDPEYFLQMTDHMVDDDDKWLKMSKDGNLIDGNGNVLDRERDAKTYQAHELGKRGYGFLKKEDPHQVLVIREWAKNRVKARNQGGVESTTLLSMYERDWLSSMSSENVPLTHPDTEQPLSKEDIRNMWLAKDKPGRAKIFDEILAPAAEEYYRITHEVYESDVENDADIAGPFKAGDENMQVHFNYLPFAEQIGILEDKMKPEPGSFGHDHRKTMHDSMIRGVLTRASSAENDPAGYVAPEVVRYYGENSMTKAGIDYSMKLQKSLGILNKKIVSTNTREEFKKFWKQAGVSQKLAKMDEYRATVGEGYWPQLVQELDLGVGARIAAMPEYLPIEKRELLELDRMKLSEMALEEGVAKDIRVGVRESLDESNMGAVLRANANVFTGENKARAISDYDSLIELLSKKAGTDVLVGEGKSKSVARSVRWLEDKHQYVADDTNNVFVSLPKTSILQSNVVTDGLANIRHNLDEELNWLDESLEEGASPEAARFYKEHLGPRYKDLLRLDGVWLNVPNSGGRRFMLVAPGGMPLLLEDGSVFTVSLNKAYKEGVTFRESGSGIEYTP